MTDITRRKFLAASGIAGVTGLAGCLGGDGGDGGGDGDGNGSDGDGGGEKRLSWHAGGTGGTYYPLSNQFKEVIDGNTDFQVQVQTTGASVENVGSLGRGEADFALIQNDVAYFAVNGEGIEAFKEGNAVENLRGVATLYPETIHVVTLKETGIQTVGDLSGKRVNTGDLGSGTQVNAKQILEVLGVTDFNEQNAGFSQAADQLKNGDIDAAFVVGGWPVGAIEDLANTNDIEIVEIKGQDQQKVLDAAPFYAADEIPGGTYSGVDNARQTVSVKAMIATNAEQPNETVNAVTSAIFDNLDQINIKTDFISKENAQEGMSIDLHPGAQEYFG